MTKERIMEVLKGIQEKVPSEWRKKVVETVKFTPTMEFIVEKALKGKKLSTKKKEQLQTLYDNGDFSKTVQRENPKYAKLINDFITREINKAIRKGQLPPRSKIKEITK